MSKTKNNSKRYKNEEDLHIKIVQNKRSKGKLLDGDVRKQKSATRKDETNSDSESDSSDSSSDSSASSSSTDTSSVASTHAKDKVIKTSEKSKIPSKSNDSKNNAPFKGEKGGINNRSKWDSPEYRRRSRSPRRERSQCRYEDRGKYIKRSEGESRDSYKDRDRERRNFHNEIKRNDNREDDRRGNRNRNDERYRQNVERPKDMNRRDRGNDEVVDKRSGDRWKNSRNENYDRAPRANQGKDRSRSRSPRRHSPKPRDRRNRRSRSFEQDYQWGKKTDEEKKHTKKPEEKEQPNFGLSGALTEDTNKVNGVVVKYAEPPEARRPKRRWRLYPFKGETALPVLHIHRQSCFLVGRERKVVDLAVDHPSCSKQHAALQYRLVSFKREDGTQGKRVRLYLIDLDSANGTFLNNKPMEARKYYELFEKDVIKFGFSTREYVLLHENSKEDQEDDDVSIKQEPAGE